MSSCLQDGAKRCANQLLTDGDPSDVASAGTEERFRRGIGSDRHGRGLPVDYTVSMDPFGGKSIVEITII